MNLRLQNNHETNWENVPSMDTIHYCVHFRSSIQYQNESLSLYVDSN
jgi:hypothetical protein